MLRSRLYIKNLLTISKPRYYFSRLDKEPTPLIKETNEAQYYRTSRFFFFIFIKR